MYSEKKKKIELEDMPWAIATYNLQHTTNTHTHNTHLTVIYKGDYIYDNSRFRTQFAFNIDKVRAHTLTFISNGVIWPKRDLQALHWDQNRAHVNFN